MAATFLMLAAFGLCGCGAPKQGAEGTRPVTAAEARQAISYVETETRIGGGGGFITTDVVTVEQVDEFIWCARLMRRQKQFVDAPYGPGTEGGACWHISRDPALDEANIDAPRKLDRNRLIDQGRWPSYVDP
jgi:hypothetical protein